MKKFVLPVVALVLAVGFASFKSAHKNFGRSTVFAEFLGTHVTANGASESDFENAAKWHIVNSSPTTCTSGDGVCVMTLNSDVYASFDGDSDEEKLANFLASQNGEAGEAANATAYVLGTSPTTKLVP